METLALNLSLDQISNMSKDSLKKLVNKQAVAKALEYLNKKKLKLSKVNQISHEKLEMQKYLMPSEMSNKQRKFLFQLRSRMLDLKVNFQNDHRDLKCDLCENHLDDQESLLTCVKLTNQNAPVTNLPKYEDIFNQDIDVQVRVSAILQEQFKLRKVLIEEKKKKK